MPSQPHHHIHSSEATVSHCISSASPGRGSQPHWHPQATFRKN